jgi:ABC-type proline/glycine betaine transport system permease subunit
MRPIGSPLSLSLPSIFSPCLCANEGQHMHYSKPISGFSAVGSAVVFVILWQLLVWLGNYDKFILPGPWDVVQQFVLLTADGRLPRHAGHTISEVIPGLLLGCAIATPLGYLLAKSATAERLLSPYLIASQAIPIIAIAPLLTIWIQSTYWSRVTVAAIVVFFPILINVITGLRAVPSEMYELMASLRATRWQNSPNSNSPPPSPSSSPASKSAPPSPSSAPWSANSSNLAAKVGLPPAHRPLPI